jgi:AcrR family transcriptional regulator
MQSENSINTGGQSGLSFIERTRRAQIVKRAIDAIATLGYAQASLAQIARCAGISKGVISYHFAGKEELIQQILAEVFTAGTAFISPGSPMVRLHAESERDYFIAQADVGVTFQVDAQDHATGIVLHLPGLPPIPAKRLDSEPGKQ